jgi:hypothetical protein
MTNNFFKIFKLDSINSHTENKNQIQVNDSKVEYATKENLLFYAINHFELTSGVLEYTDNLTGKPFNYYLSGIEINTDSIYSNSEWVDIHLEMLLNKRGKLKAVLGINPLQPFNANLNFSIENFLLSDINIYSNHYTSHSILEGDMYYYSNSIINNGNIVSENQLLLKNVSLENSPKGLYNLPLKFALFLLKDGNGDVKLNIPINGDLNDPSVNVTKLVWKAFSNLIIQVATSPAKLLAGLIGGNAKDIEELRFHYLDSIPSNKNLKQLNKLLELEQKKEGIKIELIYYVDRQLQKEAIAKNEAGKLYFNETKKDYLEDENGFEAFLLNKSTSDSLDIKQLYMAITNSRKVDSIAKNKPNQLISSVNKHLHLANDSTQIKIRLSDLNSPMNIGSMPTLKVNFSFQEGHNKN